MPPKALAFSASLISLIVRPGAGASRVLLRTLPLPLTSEKPWGVHDPGVGSVTGAGLFLRVFAVIALAIAAFILPG